MKIGVAPATPIFTGSTIVENPEVTVVQYNEAHLTEKILRGLDCLPAPDGKVTWYDVRGLSDVPLVEHLGKTFGVHPLAIEDILHTQQRPKWDDYENGVFIIVRALRHESKVPLGEVIVEQVSFYIEKNVVLTFQEDTHDLFRAVRERLTRGQGKGRQKGSDYLTYALLDCIVDDYIALLDHTEDAAEVVENQILTQFNPSVRSDIYKLKRQISEIRRIVVPMRDVVGRLSREEGEIIDPTNHIYTRDLYDHIVRVIESVENQRDMLTNLDELYNAEVANRANHVMKVLTIVSAIFIPLTFIVGVYGTNFKYVPELEFHNAYFVMWIVMLLIVIGQLIFFRWKKWL